MPLSSAKNADSRLDVLDSAINRARLALGWERLWPRLVPLLSVVGLYVVLSWLGFWRLGGDWLRLGALAALALALLWSLFRLARVSVPGRVGALRRVALRSGLPHRPARGLADRMSPVADGPAAQALWAANQERLFASLKDLRAGAPQPALAERDPNALRFAVPVLLVLGFCVAWGEWTTRLGEAFAPVAAPVALASARIDAWADPPPYTRQAPVFLSRRVGTAAAEPVSVPEGSKLTVRIVSRDPVQVVVEGGDAPVALGPKEESRPAEAAEIVRSYEAVLDRDATIAIAHSDGTTSYSIKVVEDRPPTIAR